MDLSGEVPGDDEGHDHPAHGCAARQSAPLEHPRQEQQRDRDRQRRVQHPHDRRGVEGQVPIRHLDDRQARRVRVDVVEELVRLHGHDQVCDEADRAGEGHEAQPRSLQPERGADEEQRTQVDQVSLLDARGEDGGEERGLVGRVEAEADDRGEDDAREGAHLGGPRLGAWSRQRRQPDHSRQQTDADRERPGRPHAVRDHAVGVEAGRDEPRVRVCS